MTFQSKPVRIQRKMKIFHCNVTLPECIRSVFSCPKNISEETGRNKFRWTCQGFWESRWVSHLSPYIQLRLTPETIHFPGKNLPMFDRCGNCWRLQYDWKLLRKSDLFGMVKHMTSNALEDQKGHGLNHLVEMFFYIINSCRSCQVSMMKSWWRFSFVCLDNHVLICIKNLSMFFFIFYWAFNGYEPPSNHDI